MSATRFRRIQEILARRQPDLTVLMDNVHKPHNLSAITRTCDAVGIGEVHGVSAADAFQLWHRGAMGTERWVARHAHASLDEAYASLRARGMVLAVADLSDDAIDYREVDYTQPFALVVGAELEGLTDEARDKADIKLTIPMVGMAASLNVSVAVALVLFAAFDQRERAGMYKTPRLPDDTMAQLSFEWAHPKIAAHCKRHGQPYPAMNEDGDIVGDFPRGPASLPK